MKSTKFLKKYYINVKQLEYINNIYNINFLGSSQRKHRNVQAWIALCG